jgi:hypothetical protein
VQARTEGRGNSTAALLRLQLVEPFPERFLLLLQKPFAFVQLLLLAN